MSLNFLLSGSCKGLITLFDCMLEGHVFAVVVNYTSKLYLKRSLARTPPPTLC